MSILAKAIHQARLPIELRPAARELFDTTQQQLKKCEDGYVHLHMKMWTYKGCVAEILKESILLVEALRLHVNANQQESLPSEM